MSSVLLAYDTRQPRFVALKVLKEAFRKAAGAAGRLRREAEIYSKLDHPAIVTLYETGTTADGTFYLAEEFLRGVTLEDHLAGREGLLPIPEAMILLEDMAGGLRAAHTSGVIHRDVKPQNVIVGSDGRATLFDFGIAFAQDEWVRTETGTIMGTLGYAAPEQRMGFKVDHRADVFALGAVFFELLTGARAIPDGSYEAVIRARTADLPRPSAIRPSVPEELDALAAKLLADDPEDRYQDLGVLLGQLDGLRKDLPEEVRADVFGDASARVVDRAMTAARLERWVEAKSLMGGLGEDPPEAIATRFHRVKARIHEAEGKPEAALLSLERGLEHDPGNLDMITDCAFLLLRRGLPAEAKAMLEGCPAPARFDIQVLGLIEVCDAVPALAPQAPKAPEKGGLADRLRGLWKKA